MESERKRKRKDPSKCRLSVWTALAFLLLLLYTVFLLLPLIWGLFSSLTDYSWYNSFYNLHAFKKVGGWKGTFSNFASAWKYLRVTPERVGHVKVVYEYNLPMLFLNSFLYSLGCATAFTLCPLLVAYATSRFKFKFSNVVYTFVVIALSLPIVGATPSEINMMYLLHLDAWLGGMWVLRFNFLSIYYLILHAALDAIPKDFTEASKIDGASNWTIMWRVIIPQVSNTVVTVFILSFITYWNDFQVPILYMPSYPTCATAIYLFTLRGQGGNITNRVPVQLAGCFLMILPILLLYIIFNKKLRLSVAMGGIKS